MTVDDSKATPPRRMRTHIKLVEDGTATHHVNTPDGGEPQDYGIHRRGEPHVAKFLPRAFLYGPNLFPAAAKGPPGAFATEVGLRLADARVRVVFVHAGLPLGDPYVRRRNAEDDVVPRRRSGRGPRAQRLVRTNPMCTAACDKYNTYELTN